MLGAEKQVPPNDSKWPRTRSCIAQSTAGIRLLRGVPANSGHWLISQFRLRSA